MARNTGLSAFLGLLLLLYSALSFHRGILLKDLVAIDAQGKDYGSDQRINLPKYRLLWTTLSGIRAAQMVRTSLTVDTDHMRILRVRATRDIVVGCLVQFFCDCRWLLVRLT